ncbi:glycerol-3-phosphate 1-O-acyltransferase PlsY [Thalassobius sp. S69A]|uniref:glycerol-3-phosphate 1-O-acyltransferase PlsY n=1 Tax=unclassified Thalassovita TaxID=2619711 RepID=UPI000C0FB9B8|nr:acyl-phosphate glycerol 3-phosphate acyltransferase [Paracoccaceae bacterium]MBT25830.1 acyl-phosphate glycerol 3-phosphate acyltransferase [Paracoccaceae bacterium]
MPEITSAPTILLLWAVIGYGLGAIPFGMVLAKLMGLGNLRTIGSGNIGATNVLRTGNKLAAFLTLLLDGGKGAAAVLLARALAAEDAAQIAGGMAFLGHCFPVWLKFKGGKGVATFLGLLLGLAWPVGLAACATWLVTALLVRISSFSALMAAATSTMWMVLLGQGNMIALGIVLTLLIFWTHRANITRIRQGSEPKIGQK